MIERYSDISHIKGWFGWYDYKLFEVILSGQADSELGTLVELGAYLGKSAVVIGDALRPGEEFVVLDLFGAEPDAVDPGNHREVRASYRTLSQQKFEDNYRSVHASLPRIVRAPSSEIMNHVQPGTVRFCHIDASHLYRNVVEDAENAEQMMRPGGVVVFDDYRSAHTPGVAAVVWDLVMTNRFIPVAITPQKMYGCFSAPGPTHDTVIRFARESRLRWEEQKIADYSVIRLSRAKRPKSTRPPEQQLGLTEERLAAIMRQEYARAVDTLAITVQAQLSAARTQLADDVNLAITAELGPQLRSSMVNGLQEALEGQMGKKFARRVAQRVKRQVENTGGFSRFLRPRSRMKSRN